MPLESNSSYQFLDMDIRNISAVTVTEFAGVYYVDRQGGLIYFVKIINLKTNSGTKNSAVPASRHSPLFTKFWSDSDFSYLCFSCVRPLYYVKKLAHLFTILF